MKITYNWLKEFIEGLDTFSAAEIAEKLTMSGTEVKKVENIGEKYRNIVIAQILSFGKHPNADKLSLCSVSAGSRTYSIVCGANNFKENDIVALALEGAKIKDFTIKRSKIRGEISEGMMCSEAELGFSTESEGIMILENSCKIGESFASQVGLDDYVFEIEVTPNRPDCLSVIGIAREISAVTGLKLKYPEYDFKDEINKDEKISIEIKDFDLCPRYSAKVFENLGSYKIPDWLKNRLLFCDIRSIDLIVDLTNYVMLETGQPMHAFDLDMLSSKKIIIRRAEADEKITLIDGTSKKLLKNNLVIADEKAPIALAGVMGGIDTEITPKTRNVILESANFNGPSIMKTSKSFGLRSEASGRFEKKLDPMLTVYAIKRFESLLESIAGFKSSTCIYDCMGSIDRTRNIMLYTEKTSRFLGVKLKSSDLSKILSSLEIKNTISGENIEAFIPSFRFEDLEREIDLIEEIARIYGFENIPAQKLNMKSLRGGYTKKQMNLKDIRNTLCDAGLNEVINYSFIGKKDFNFFTLKETDDYKDYVKILNPLNEDFEILRTSLLQSMVKNLGDNLKKKNLDINIFEISRVFNNKSKDGILPFEKNVLSILISGKSVQKNWTGNERNYDFYDLKGIIEYIFEKYRLNNSLNFKANEYKFFHPAISADIFIDNLKVGIIGRIHPKLLDQMDIKQEAFFTEIDLDKFIDLESERKKYFQSLPQFPGINIDLALVLNDEITSKEIENEIKKTAGKLLRDIKVFDVYKGKQIEEGKKSLAYSLEFMADDRTLKDLEIELISKRIIEVLNKKFGAYLRQ